MIRIFYLAAPLVMFCVLTGCGRSPSTAPAETRKPAAAAPAQAVQPAVLHVIGVYEGSLPASADQRPWWAQCDKGQRADDKGAATSPPGATQSTRSPDCMPPSSASGPTRTVQVTVSDGSQPIVLGLMAYDRVHWLVQLAPDVKLERVVLAGYHTQSFEGIPSTVQVDVYTYDPSGCSHCMQKGPYFYSYSGVPAQMETAAGLKAKSFQGRYTGEQFAIFPGMN